MLFGIIACVLAVIVPVVGALALSIYVQNVRSTMALALSASSSATRDTLTTSYAQLNAKIDALRDRMSACESDLKLTSNAHLSTELAALAGDVDSLAKGVRKNFGRVFAELHLDGTLKRNTEKQTDIETAEEVRARLRIQHGLPKLGGTKLNGE